MGRRVGPRMRYYPLNSMQKFVLDAVQGIRAILRDAKVHLRPGEGFDELLKNAEIYARGPGQSGVDPRLERAAHAVLALSDNLRECADHGLGLKSHLLQMGTGTTDYGAPAPRGTEARRIYFKDFECEVFVAATLLRNGVEAAFVDPPNDPCGDIVVSPLRVEVKHPDSRAQLLKLAAKFQRKLSDRGLFGVFAAGLEDAFVLASQPAAADQDDYMQWRRERNTEMEAFGLDFIGEVARYDRILALVQTASVLVSVGGSESMQRHSNSFIFDDRRQADSLALAQAERIARVFNPKPRRYSQLVRIEG